MEAAVSTAFESDDGPAGGTEMTNRKKNNNNSPLHKQHSGS